MKKNKYPSVSFAIATYNSARTLTACLQAVSDQEYPGKIEIVIADGGSSDVTKKIARKYGARVYSVDISKQNAEYNKGIAVNHCKNEIIALIDHDNILPHKKWLTRMVQPLVEHKEIIGSAVLRFHYDRTMTSLDRYFALLGAADPVAFFLNKSAHQSYLYHSFRLRGEVLKNEKGYYIVNLDPDRMPALGGNGALIRRSMLKYALSDPDNFFHIDIHVDMAKKGYTNYAFVKETIYHFTNNTFISFMKRRIHYVIKYHYADHHRRRYSIFEPEKDKAMVLLYILYTISTIPPLIHSIRGYVKIRDLAWLLHPLMCWAMLLGYGFPIIFQKAKYVFIEK